jgi:transcriptional regulator with XRE-family HTH domain
MNRYNRTLGHLERSVQDHALRRALAARLDRALKRGGITSAQAAKWIGVSAGDVQFWRHGITVPPMAFFTRIAAALDLDADWLCTGRT